MKPIFHINRQPWRDNVEVFFRIYFGDGPMHVALPVMMEQRMPAGPGEMRAPILPMLTIEGREGDAAMQNLMDELWKEGYRPRDIGTAGHLAATQAHLADFRALVSKTLDVKLP